MNESIFLSISLLLFLVFLLFASLRAITRLRRSREKREEQDKSDVSFIVDTFHDLLSKLKQKEEELDNLRKKAEVRANIIESYNEYILQSVPSGVISLDRDGKVTKINSAAERILDIRSTDVLGRGFRDIFREPLLSLLNRMDTIERKEVQYKTDSGRTIHLGLTVTPLLNGEGEIIGQIMVFTDLTDLKALETQAKLRDRLSSLGEMAAGIAHELRNPMGVIAGYTKILQKKVDPSLQEIVDSISKEVSIMDRIISDFLSFARPTNINLYEINLAHLIEDCLNNIPGEKDSRKDITVISDLDGLPLIYGDELLLKQAFNNIIQNAIEAMPQGGELRLTYRMSHDNVELLISDTGHGISPEIKDKIFLPFYSTKEKGTGLGLAIAQKVIISHRGDIGIDDSGKGTTFIIKLPLKAS
jgi:PAS domain S-box-containing protein